MDNCIFCQIASGKIPSYKVWEDDKHLAFLDIRPIKDGHTMIIPKNHHSYFFEMPDDELTALTLASKKVAKLLQKAFKPKSGRIGAIVYGLDVDHVHIHLVPIDKTGDLSFANSKPASKESLEKTLEAIKMSS